MEYPSFNFLEVLAQIVSHREFGLDLAGLMPFGTVMNAKISFSMRNIKHIQYAFFIVFVLFLYLFRLDGDI